MVWIPRIAENEQDWDSYVGVSKNNGVSPNHPLNNRVFHYFHHPFWDTPIFGNTHVKRIRILMGNAKKLSSKHESLIYHISG